MKFYTISYTYSPMDSWDNVSVDVNFASLNNAKFVARQLSKCFDVVGNVDIINGLTGEVVAIYKEGKETYSTEE